MDKRLIQVVLTEAGEEGRCELSPLLWNSTGSDAQSRALEKIERDFPSHFLALPDIVHDEIQMIYENIQSIASEQDLKVIGTVGVSPNAGTSSIAAMLTMIAAGSPAVSNDSSDSQNGSKSDAQLILNNSVPGVLLVDAQLRQPTIHKMFGLSSSPGLHDFLNAGTSSSPVINYIPHLNLNVITAGNPEKKLHQTNPEQIRSLFRLLRTKFARVFVDIPSVLHFADGQALAKLCDGVVLVLRAGQSRKEAVRKAQRYFEKAQVNVIGGVLNRRKFFVPERLYRFL